MARNQLEQSLSIMVRQGGVDGVPGSDFFLSQHFLPLVQLFLLVDSVRGDAAGYELASYTPDVEVGPNACLCEEDEEEGGCCNSVGVYSPSLESFVIPPGSCNGKYACWYAFSEMENMTSFHLGENACSGERVCRVSVLVAARTFDIKRCFLLFPLPARISECS